MSQGTCVYGEKQAVNKRVKYSTKRVFIGEIVSVQKSGVIGSQNSQVFICNTQTQELVLTIT